MVQRRACPSSQAIKITPRRRLCKEEGGILVEDLYVLIEYAYILIGYVYVLMEDVHILIEDVHILIEDVHIFIEDVHIFIEDMHVSTKTMCTPSWRTYSVTTTTKSKDSGQGYNKSTILYLAGLLLCICLDPGA